MPSKAFCATCFPPPPSYEFERVDAHPAATVLGGDPEAAVAFYGAPDRPTDWQTQLTPFEDWDDTDGERRVPLSGVAETLARSDATAYTDRQCLFLQAVFTAQQLRYDPLEYDLLEDSMLRLQEYLDIDSDAIQDLVDDGLLTHDTDRPHRLYSVTPEGRQVIDAPFRRGHEYGHGQGDLEETSQHVLAVEAARRYLEQHDAANPNSRVEEVVPYFDLEREDGPVVSLASAMGDADADLAEAYEEYDHRRIDVAGLDGEGNVVVAVEAERINHDHRRAVPKDFDKMAHCDPDEVVWVAMSHDAGHEILAALQDPLDGEPRWRRRMPRVRPSTSSGSTRPGVRAC